MTKYPGPWFSLLWTYNSVTEGITGAFIVKLNNNRDTDERASKMATEYAQFGGAPTAPRRV